MDLVKKFPRKSDTFFSGDNEPTGGKMPYLALSKNPLKLPMDADPQADDLQNSISSSSSTDKPLMKLS